jgi:hypothetical protein
MPENLKIPCEIYWKQKDLKELRELYKIRFECSDVYFKYDIL